MADSRSPSPSPCTENQMYSVVGFFLQCVIYGGVWIVTELRTVTDFRDEGGYLTLFLKTLPGMFKRHRKTARVFVAGNVILFVLTTFDTCMKVYTASYAFDGELSQGGSLTCALECWGRWDTFISAVTTNVIVWIMDILVLFRCFIIWERKWRVIVSPSILLLISISINTFILCWFADPDGLDDVLPAVKTLRHLCYPINFAVNFITTGLIAYAILGQHYASAAAGVRSTDRLSLVYIARVVIESALIYTVQVLVLSVLHQFKHPVVTIFQTTLTPSVGITFLLMAMRVDLTREAGEGTALRSGFTFHTWYSDSPASKSTESEESNETLVKEEVV